MLQGYRDRAPANIDGIADILVRLSRMICDCAEIVELDMNPLLADGDTLIALDARVKIGTR